MKKLIILLLLPTGILAQTSVGISPSKFNLLKDYRLPAWGYSEVQFNLNGEFSGVDNNGTERDRVITNLNLNFAPTIIKYSESENSIRSLHGSINLHGYHSKSSNKYSNNQEKTKNNNSQFYSTFSFSTENKNYFAPKYFWALNMAFDAGYHERHERSEYRSGQSPVDKNSTSIFIRPYQIVTSGGIGIGRVRDISPIIRALRFNERIHALGRDNLVLDDMTIQKIASQFTKYYGYISLYDRPEKYLWDDVFQLLGDRLSSLSTFEILYISDVLYERIGERFEGSEIDIGPVLTHFNGTAAEYYSNSHKYRVEKSAIGAYLNARAYHNFSVNYQLGIDYYWTYRKVLNKNTSRQTEGNSFIQAAQLYTITDRILWETKIGMNVDVMTNKTSEDKTKWSRIDAYSLDSRISFFVENNLAFYFDLRIETTKYRPEGTASIFMDFYSYSSYYLPDRYIYRSDFEREANWRLSFGFRYYFGSGLR